SLALMVASLARRGARLQVARLRLAPRRLLRAAALSLSWLPRSLAAARGSKSLGCASLHVASCAPPLSRSHGCLARSPRRAAPSRSAAPRSTSPLARRRSLALMVASLPRRGARLQVARLRLAPRRLLRAAALSLSPLRPSDGDAVDLDRGGAHAHGHRLAVLAARPHPVGELEVAPHHRYPREHVGPVADEVHPLERGGDLAVLDEVALGQREHEVPIGDVDLAAGEPLGVHAAHDRT